MSKEGLVSHRCRGMMGDQVSHVGIKILSRVFLEAYNIKFSKINSRLLFIKNKIIKENNCSLQPPFFVLVIWKQALVESTIKSDKKKEK